MKELVGVPLLESPVGDAIEARIAVLERAALQKKMSLKNRRTKEKLIIKQNGKYQEYFCRSENTRKLQYLRKGDGDRIRFLAQTDYDRQALAAMEEELVCLRQIQQKYQPNKIGDIYDSFAEVRKKLVTPCVLSNAPYDFARVWEQRAYEHKPIPPEYEGFVTLKGDRVRSKSEIMIANALALNHIPYHYEEPLYLHGYGLIHPDFSILKMQEWRIIIWEHCGMMDNKEYCNKAIPRINALNANGYFQGINLITTFETHDCPLTTQQIDMVIRQFFLS